MEENVENLHCRLCAELKPNTKLIDLQSEDGKRKEILRKLKKLNVRALEVFDDELLPKTVCFVCISSLDRAFEFILNVEHAQELLSNLLTRRVKKELSDIDSDADDSLFGDSVLKIEDALDVKLEIQEDVDTQQGNDRKRKKKVKTSKFLSLDSLPLSQLKLTWRNYLWTCSYCETQFGSAEELKMHSIQFHSCCNAFKCTDCNVRKMKLDNFLLHVKRHRKYLKLSCHVCHLNFLKPYQANIHKNVHNNSEHICKGCNSNFPTVDELNDHANLYFTDRRARRNQSLPMTPDDLTCVLCKKIFKSKGSLSTHLLTHTDRKRDHTCEKCGKCFFSKTHLAGHMLQHNESRPNHCKICNLGFKTLTQLRNHVGVHDGKKPYSCDQCGRCFRLPKQLKSHLIIHTDELPFICAYCGKGFRFKTILNQHVRQHTGIKPYTCGFCQRNFTNWPNYNKHMKRRHGMDMAKKKHTPLGAYPINPATGEVVITPETVDTREWKMEMLKQRRPGRPKQNVEASCKTEVETKVENQTQ